MPHISTNDSTRVPKDDGREETRLEQGTLFDFGTPSPKNTKVANHPTRLKKAMNPSVVSVKPDELPKPYVPRHHTYSEHLKWFNGIHDLALYWFNHQDIKD